LPGEQRNAQLYPIRLEHRAPPPMHFALQELGSKIKVTRRILRKSRYVQQRF
jgi:hypothetical protein